VGEVGDADVELFAGKRRIGGSVVLVLGLGGLGV